MADLTLMIKKPRTKLTSQMLQKCVPKVDLKKKKESIAVYIKSYNSEQIRFFESMSLKDFTKRVMSLQITAKHLELIQQGEFKDVSQLKERFWF